MPLRGLVAQAIPFQLEENDVFRGNEQNRVAAAVLKALGPAPAHGGLVEGPIFPHEHVHFECRGKVNNVEGSSAPHCVLNGEYAQVVLVSERRTKRRFLAREGLRSDVGIVCEPEFALE